MSAVHIIKWENGCVGIIMNHLFIHLANTYVRSATSPCACESTFINLLNHEDGSFSVIISMILFSGKYPLIFYSKFILISWPAADPIHLMASGYLQYVCEWEMINIFNNFVGWENKRTFNDLVVIFYITLHYTRTRSNSDSSRG